LEATLVGHILIEAHALAKLLRVDSWFELTKKRFSNNNIYAIQKEYSSSHELHPITSVRGVGEAQKAPQRGQE